MPICARLAGGGVSIVLFLLLAQPCRAQEAAIRAAGEDQTAVATVVPLSQRLSFNVDGTIKALDIIAGEPIEDALSRACTVLLLCNPHQRQLIRWNILLNPEVTGTTAHMFLINQCGTHAGQSPRTGEFAMSKVADFIAPLFPGRPEKIQDFFFPVIENDWVSVVVKACGCWEPGMTLLQALSLSPLNSFAQRSDVVINAGSQLGWYSLFASKVCGVSKVFAFECHPGTAYQNMQGIMRNNLSHTIRLSTAAISNSSGGTSFMPFKEVSNRGGLSLVRKTWQGAFAVPTTSIDQLNLSHARLVTADVNGFDVELLLGARAMIENNGAIDYMILEMGPLSSERVSVVELLHDHGYIVSCIDGVLGREAGVLVESDTSRAQFSRVGRFVQNVQQELADLLPEQCGGRMHLESVNGSRIVTVCDRASRATGVGEQYQESKSEPTRVRLAHCHNAFIARSEEALAGVVDLALALTVQ